jgi:hypothetical protein
LTRPAKSVECSKCGRVGRHKKNSVTYSFSYPLDVIRVPKLEDVESISDAWDYASKVCLHMSRMILRFPPSQEMDQQLASAIYDHFRTLTIHTDVDVAAFESRHRKLIEQKMLKQEPASLQQKQQEQGSRRLSDYDQLSFDTSANEEEVIHTPLPSDTGRVTHLSLALLYGAIVCKVINNRSYNEKSAFEPSKQKKTVARAICIHYSIYYSDERMRKDWISWIEIMQDVEREGLGAAIKKHQTITPEGDKVKLSRKEIKKMESKVLQKAQDIVTYMPIFDQLFTGLGRHMRNDPDSAARFLEDFSKLEYSIYDQQTTYRYAWVLHEKGKPCSVSPHESLRIVKVGKSAEAR